jgi:hypothetical protein
VAAANRHGLRACINLPLVSAGGLAVAAPTPPHSRPIALLMDGMLPFQQSHR